MTTLETVKDGIDGLVETLAQGNDRVSDKDAAQNFYEACYNASEKSGWWTNVETGERLPCDVSLKMSLVHSEVSEALEGDRKNLMDDKLPERPMFEVELADVAIRLGDLVGRIAVEEGINPKQFGRELAEINRLHLANAKSPVTGVVPYDLDRMHYFASEVYRVRTIEGLGLEQVNSALAVLFFVILETAAVHNLDLGGAIAEKMAFNAKRADHKMANRTSGAAGAKTY